MKGKDLLEAMEYLEDDIIETAHEHKQAKKYAKRRVFISLAACLACVFLLCAAVVLPVLQKAHREEEPIPTERNLPERNDPEYNDREEILIPFAGEIDLTEDVRMISEDDLLDFNLKWQETGDRQWETDEEFDFFMDFMNSHKIQVSGKALYDWVYCNIYYVADNSHNFLCSVKAYDGSMGAFYLVPTFYSYWSYLYFSMGKSEEEYLDLWSEAEGLGIGNKSAAEHMKSYLEIVKQRRSATQEQTGYIARNLDETDYGGSFYDSENDNYVVWLLNESRREELEQRGIVCKAARYSMQQLYEKMHKLWDRKEELEILWLGIDYYHNRLDVRGAFTKEEFIEKLNDSDLSDMIEYDSFAGIPSEQRRAHAGMRSAVAIEDADEFINFIKTTYAIDYLEDVPDEAAQEYFDDLKTALVKLKEKYPEYTYLQLYYHVSTDCEYEYYLNFDQDLEDFTDTLPAYRKDMDFLREQQYGDPERLGLKAVLYRYKQLYPKESYQKLYETYLAPLDLEQKFCPKAERLYQYLYIKALQKEGVEQKQKGKADALLKQLRFLFYIIFSCAAVFFALLLRAHFKKRRMEKAEFHAYLIRETAALSANLALFVFLPYILLLIAPQEIMSVIFLPDYYLGPFFGLIGSAVYTLKKGNWWNFMLYTTVCLILQPLAILESAGTLYIVFLIYILPAEILGTLYGKLKGRIKIIK